MYLTYDTNQIPYGEANTVEQQQQRTSSAPPFRPRWLIRISDMKKVPGEQASKEDGYCALSYSWTWSGERVTDKKGNQTVEDKGKHQIISSTGIPQDAKFIDVLRKIAQDLNVKYLWFDRECVAMDQEEDKLNSLRTMDLTYSHADFTLALVPEMEASHELKSIYPTNNDNNLSQEQQRLYIETLENCLNKIITCEWSTRVWLLVEAMMSKRILYMGKDAHVWSDGLAQYTSSIRSGAKVSLEAIQSLSSFTTASHKDASKILWHAHRRNTSLDYDRVFALIHIFSTIDMPIRYGASEDLPNYMIEFYTKLIKKDWTMLCFGKQHPDYPCRMERYTEFMPSWTGISGTHIQHTSMAQVPETHQRSIVVKEYSSTKEKDDRGKICIDTGSFSFLSHGVLERIDNNSTSLTGNEKHLEERYGILWTHRFYKNKNDKNSIILLSLVIDDEEAEKENGCIVLDIPFVWQTCVVRPVIVKKKRSVNNGNSSSSSSEPFLYQSIGLSALLSPVALDHFWPCIRNYIIYYPIKKIIVVCSAQWQYQQNYLKHNKDGAPPFWDKPLAPLYLKNRIFFGLKWGRGSKWYMRQKNGSIQFLCKTTVNKMIECKCHSKKKRVIRFGGGDGVHFNGLYGTQLLCFANHLHDNQISFISMATE